MKIAIRKIAETLQVVFGYGIMLCLFAGGFTFFGYLVALVVGGDTAVAICDFIYKDFFPVVIKISNIMVILGLLIMYMKGEVSLTINNKQKKK